MVLNKQIESQNKAYEQETTEIAKSKNQALSELLENQRLIGAITEAIPYILYLYDIEKSKYLYANAEFEKFMGMSIQHLEEQFKQKGVQFVEQFVHPDDLPVFLEMGNRILHQGEQMHEVVYRLKHHKDGFRWVINRIKALKTDEKGKTTQFIVVNIDIHEKVVAEEQIRKSEQKYRSLVETTDTGYVIMDENWKIIDANSEFVRLTGHLELSEILGQNMFFWISEHEVERVSLAKEIFEEQDSLKNFELDFIYTKNHSITLEVNLSKINEQIIALCRDTTQRKKAEQKLQQQYDQLQKINKEIDRFVYSASHDLRTPISSMLGLVNLLHIENEDAMWHQYLNMMNDSIKRLDKITKDIVHYSFNSRTETIYEAINFKNLIETIFEEVHVAYPHHCVKLNYTIIGTKDFYSDKSRLHTVFQGLIQNAVRFCDLQKAECYAKVIIRLANDAVEVDIEDNGLGIDKNYVDRVFDMFYKASEESSGAGLGLFVAKEIIQHLGGKISVSSQLKKGTIFSIYLPQYIKN